jgi:hypothetical protein
MLFETPQIEMGAGVATSPHYVLVRPTGHFAVPPSGALGANRPWHGGVKTWFDDRLETSIRFGLHLGLAPFLLPSRRSSGLHRLICVSIDQSTAVAGG